MRPLEEFLRRIIEFGLVMDDEEKMIEKELLNIELHWQPKTLFLEFFEQYNKVRNTRYNPDIESRKLYYETETIYTNEERIKALRNAMTDPYWVERSFDFPPKWILKSENLQKYLTYAAPNSRTNAAIGKHPKRESVA